MWPVTAMVDADGVGCERRVGVKQQLVIETRSLRHSYGGVQAVRGLDIGVAAGEMVGLIGPNGAGKSTVIECISGSVRGFSGSVLLYGTDISRWPMHRIARAGLLRTYQIPRLFRRLSVISNLMLAAEQGTVETMSSTLLGRWRARDAERLSQCLDVLQRFGLLGIADNAASDLSGGQERLVELCRILLMRPKVVLLDEPFAGVSPENRYRLAEAIDELRAAGSTLLMVEHRLEWVERLCERVVVMAQGQQIAAGVMDDIRGNKEVIESYLGTKSHSRPSASKGARA